MRVPLEESAVTTPAKERREANGMEEARDGSIAPNPVRIQ
jgi:hypothetical protein